MPTKLGQNFLVDTFVVDKIIAAANLKSDDFVLEVGPGKGILTEKLAEKSKKVIAIELDKDLAAHLRDRFNGKKDVEVIQGDILRINLEDLTSEAKKLTKLKSYRVVANIPYYITSKIIRLFLEAKNPPQEMILMVQKEVARRIVALPGEMSLLSVSVQYYADPEILFEVPRKCFSPVPEVDSAVIKLTTNDNQLVAPSAKHFFRIVRSGFSAKRKTLANNLSSSLHLEKSSVEEKLEEAGLDPLVRAQELSLDDWKKIVKRF